MLTVLAFVVALGLLVAVHEYGHYRMAVACGVKVLRFSVGFGKTLWRWQPANQKNGQNTEFVIGAVPLGGFVRMLDEREAPVPPDERHRAFNTQRLRSRVLIVAAGPAANLLLAVLLYALVSWIGVPEPKAVLSTPVAGSVAERAGLRAGDWVHQVAEGEDSPEPVQSFDQVRWRLTQAALSAQDLTLWVGDSETAPARPVRLPLAELGVRDPDAALFQRIGLLSPWSAPEIGEVMPDGAAAAAGLRVGDLVHRVDGREVPDAQTLRQWIRSAADGQGRGRPQQWEVYRSGALVGLTVTPVPELLDGQWTGRIGAFVGAPPAMVTVSDGPLGALAHGIQRTWEVSVLTLKMLGRMVIGEASLKNLSGPLTIADYAGKSASLGLTSYLLFLALISVSLGVLNLLPLPVLDGGHLMYYLWEGVTGRGVSVAWMERLQRGGAAVLMLLMSVALFNDVARLLG